MTDQNECMASIKGCLRKTAAWRRTTVAKRFPNDPRNLAAADTLNRLADAADDFTDTAWEALQPYFAWSSLLWASALSWEILHDSRFRISNFMTRTRTPTAVLALRGSFKRHPERAREREGEPKPTNPLGPAPSGLKKDEKAAWNDMRAEGFWLTSADGLMVQVAAGLMALHRSRKIDNPARSLLVSTLSKLGFGPTERSKLKVPDANGDNPFEQFM